MAASLRARLRARQPLIGMFVRTPAAATVEVLAGTGLDFVVLDAEHAPLDAATLDQLVLAARAVGLPVLVRVREGGPAEVLSVLDMGANGIFFPHISTAPAAEAAVAACLYGGARGFSGSHRAGGYGTRGMAEQIASLDAETVIVCQIEDAEAVDNAAEIAAIERIDALMIGRADLTVSLGCTDLADPAVARAVERIYDAGRMHARAIGMLSSDPGVVAKARTQGASMFLLGTDQGLFRNAVAARAAALGEVLS